MPRDEDLFYGNMADLGSSTDDSVLTYCTCDNYNVVAPQCGRKAVSDTTADFVEPRTHVSLIVPVRSPRRRRRDVGTGIASSGEDYGRQDDKGKQQHWRKDNWRYVYGKCLYNNVNAQIETVSGFRGIGGKTCGGLLRAHHRLFEHSDGQTDGKTDRPTDRFRQ